jgi:hypothetical protein
MGEFLTERRGEDGLKSRVLAKFGGRCRKWHMLAFVGICAAAVAIRSVPAWIYAGWGTDLGIYYGLTSSLVNSGAIFPAYTGWGQSYEHFPVLYIVTALPHLLTGADVFWLMTRVAPLFGGLSVAFAYGIARNIGMGRKSALLAMALLAVNSVHVFQTSHAAPLTMGHFFLLACVYLATKPSMGRADWALLLASTVLLVGSHHLSTYVWLVAMPAMLALQRRQPSKALLLYVAFASGLAFAYWGLVATEVLGFVGAGTGLPWPAIIPAYAGFVALAIFARERLKPVVGWLAKPVPRRAEVAKFWLAFSALLCTVLLLAGAGSSAVNVRVTPLFALYAVPMFAILAFGSAGIAGTSRLDGGPQVVGWFSAVALSMAAALAVGSGVLLPERHLEYLMEPLSIFAAIGMVVLLAPSLEKALRVEKTRRFAPFRPVDDGVVRSSAGGLAPERLAGLPGRNRPGTAGGIWVEETNWKVGAGAAVPALVIVLLVGSALASYRALPEVGIEDRISGEDLAAVEWLGANASAGLAVATDHRLGTQLEAKGVNATFERGAVAWNSTSWQSFIGSLAGTDGTRVGYVLVDDVMRESGVSLAGVGLPPVPDATYGLFSAEPFGLAARFENSTSGTWAEIYSVNWTFIGNATATPTRSAEGNLNVGAVQSTPSATDARDAGGRPRGRAAVTQLGECLTEDQVVAGSSPACGIKFIFVAIHAAGDLNLQNS